MITSPPFILLLLGKKIGPEILPVVGISISNPGRWHILFSYSKIIKGRRDNHKTVILSHQFCCQDDFYHYSITDWVLKANMSVSKITFIPVLKMCTEYVWHFAWFIHFFLELLTFEHQTVSIIQSIKSFCKIVSFGSDFYQKYLYHDTLGLCKNCLLLLSEKYEKSENSFLSWYLSQYRTLQIFTLSKIDFSFHMSMSSHVKAVMNEGKAIISLIIHESIILTLYFPDLHTLALISL